MEVCLNARGSVCPGLASLALMDMSVLLIAGLQEKMCLSFFMHSLHCGQRFGDVSLPLWVRSLYQTKLFWQKGAVNSTPSMKDM